MSRLDLDFDAALLEVSPLPDLPPPPAAQRGPGAVEAGSPPPPELVALGEPPASAAAALEWTFRAVVASIHSVIHDESLSPRARRQELRQTASVAASLYPDSAKAEVARALKARDAKLDAAARRRAAAPLAPRPPAGKPIRGAR